MIRFGAFYKTKAGVSDKIVYDIIAVTKDRANELIKEKGENPNSFYLQEVTVPRNYLENFPETILEI
jgi:hypothetical protein